MITLSDILKIDNLDIYYFDHYKDDKPNGHRLWWGELYPLEKATTDTINDRLTNPEWKNNDLYLISKYMQYGDYDDSCMVERSNYKLFLENFGDLNGVYTISGGYGSSGIALSIAWLSNPDNEDKSIEIIDLLNNLNDYPCIDDEDMSNMEYESFLEALDNFAIRECNDLLSKQFLLDVYDYNEDKLKDVLLDSNSKLSYDAYEIESGGSCYIDTKRLIEKVSLREYTDCLIDFELRG
jgi:hypothetical protein